MILTVTEILADVISSFKVRVPMLQMMTTDFRSDQAQLGQTLKMHIRSLPAVGDYDPANGGYFNGANESRDLLEDVDVVMSNHKHVTLSVEHLNAISDSKYDVSVSDAAYVLGKAIVDSVLAKLLVANISRNVIEASANVDRATLGKARSALNKAGAFTEDRCIIGNTDFMEALGEDGHIISSDFHGQKVEGSSLASYKNIQGFRDIYEYPDLPDNGENLQAVGFDPRLMGLRTALPADTSAIAAELGISTVANTEVYTDPETNISLLAITHQEPGTLKLLVTLTAIWGSHVGSAGKGTDKLTDKAGIRFVTA